MSQVSCVVYVAPMVVGCHAQDILLGQPTKACMLQEVSITAVDWIVTQRFRCAWRDIGCN